MAASEGIITAFAPAQEQGRDGGLDIMATLHALDGRFACNLGYCSRFKRKEYLKLLSGRKTIAATKIQSLWRGCSLTAKYYVTLFEKDATTLLQSYWRRFVQFSKSLIALDSSSNTIQTSFRSRKAFAIVLSAVLSYSVPSVFCCPKENGSTRHYPYVGGKWSHFWWYRPLCSL
jgi:hypothetical protein